MKKSIIKIALCLIAVLFAVSCGKDANSSMTPITMDDTYDFKVYLSTAAAQNDDRINVSSDKSKVSKASALEFSMTPGFIESAEAAITSVTKGDNNNSSLILDTADFTLGSSTISDLTEVSLTLSQEGINKIKTADLTSAAEYIYNVDVTFTSDNEKLRNKEAVVTVPIKILVIKNVTKTDIENIIKKANSGTITISGGKASFNLNSFALSKSGSTITSTGDGGGTYKAYDAAQLFSKITDDNLKYSPYAKTSPISGDAKTANFTITLQFKDGYEIEDPNYAFVNTDGVKLSLKLDGNGSWTEY
ncbi:hypothetical protein Q5M87_08120 [Brachyspira innocens]|uniref:DUF1735 domain-containing protein n=1 Tax=Brachyspira innocens TaxID=13264 RepID=A0ABT8YXI2_9SPIR|nr:hypothetical protein [Brachyspira innocens]MDO6993977.1 hypothetical protein [Brachyspira innocens]MDO7019953.1 hypothetical protein [Brachyspira innocens]